MGAEVAAAGPGRGGDAHRTFFDTNVLVYAHDAGEPRKRDVARALFLDHLASDTLCTSVQVLSEYFSVVTTKGETRMDPTAAGWLIRELPADAVTTAGVDGLRAAAARCVRDGLSIWDALVVEAARAAGAEVLLTEDAELLRCVVSARDGLRAEDPFATEPG